MKNADVDAAVEKLLQEHLLAGPRPGQCRCGWGSGQVSTLGKSHSEHVTLRLRDANLLRTDR